MAKRFEITNGPSKWDLILTVFEGNGINRKDVTFSLEDPSREPGLRELLPFPVVINEVKREDVSSDEDWYFQGHPVNDCHCTMQGFFSTRTRKGWVEF